MRSILFGFVGASGALRGAAGAVRGAVGGDGAPTDGGGGGARLISPSINAVSDVVQRPRGAHGDAASSLRQDTLYPTAPPPKTHRRDPPIDYLKAHARTPTQPTKKNANDPSLNPTVPNNTISSLLRDHRLVVRLLEGDDRGRLLRLLRRLLLRLLRRALLDRRRRRVELLHRARRLERVAL